MVAQVAAPTTRPSSRRSRSWGRGRSLQDGSTPPCPITTPRATAQRIWDRTPGTEPAVQMANQLGMVSARLNCKPRWRDRLPELTIPALVVHGRRDPFFPVGNGEAQLARRQRPLRHLVLSSSRDRARSRGCVSALRLLLLSLR
jgi:pimeloyl-ACP methyl ester carboxylesterase